jgi:cell division protein FtsI (penicillin-binding protein 3)
MDRLAPVSADRLSRMRATGHARIQAMTAMLSLGVLVVAVRATWLALFPDPRTLELATAKRYASATFEGSRGEIVDARGRLLAKSVPSPTISLDAAFGVEQIRIKQKRDYRRAHDGEAPDEATLDALTEARLDVVAAALAEILDRTPEEMRALLVSGKRYIKLATNAHPQVADKIQELGLDKEGVRIDDSYTRFYPQGTLAGQALGFVGAGAKGVEGLEASMDAYLAGGTVLALQRVNRDGAHLDREAGRDGEMRGKRVVTTLDRDLQQDLEAALQRTIALHHPLWVTAVVVEVATGRVVGMATAPSFDPNRLDPDDYGLTRNRAVMDAVEPGSVFKPFTFAAAVEAGVTTPNEMLPLTPSLVIYDRKIGDMHFHGPMTSAEVLKYSSNVGAATLALRLGTERILSYFEAFGFGESTGVELRNEALGRRGPSRVGRVETATISYGQGITATAMQLAMATAALGNGGRLMQAILVDRVEDAEGNVVYNHPPTVRAQVVSPETARATVEAMSHVTEPGSTAPYAKTPGYRIAGKTGTAHKVKDGAYSETARYSSFIGLAPAENPKYAMAIIVDEPSSGVYFGGKVAAPPFPLVMGPALRRAGIPADDGAEVGSALADLDAPGEAVPVVMPWLGEGWRMPDLIGRDVRSALAGLQGTGVRIALTGRGFVVAQAPTAGAVVAPGADVLLELR